MMFLVMLTACCLFLCVVISLSELLHQRDFDGFIKDSNELLETVQRWAAGELCQKCGKSLKDWVYCVGREGNCHVRCCKDWAHNEIDIDGNWHIESLKIHPPKPKFIIPNSRLTDIDIF